MLLFCQRQLPLRDDDYHLLFSNEVVAALDIFQPNSRGRQFLFSGLKVIFYHKPITSFHKNLGVQRVLRRYNIVLDGIFNIVQRCGLGQLFSNELPKWPIEM